MYPYLNYAVEVWGDTHSCYLEPIVKLQKKAVRIITKSKRYAHTEPLFHQLKILNLEKIHVYKVAIAMFRLIDGKTPLVFSELFQYNHSIHSYGTRQSAKFHVPITKVEYMKRSITVKGVNIWNNLYDIIRHDCMLQTYKYHLRIYLIQLHNTRHIYNL